jgi:hypothetical protein
VSDGGFAIAWTAPGRRVDVLAIEHRSTSTDRGNSEAALSAAEAP